MAVIFRSLLFSFITVTLFNGTIKAQQKQDVGCKGLIVYNYNINSGDRIAYNFRKTVVAKLDCKIIDHTMDATLVDMLRSLSKKKDVRDKLRKKYSDYNKVMFLEYEKILKKNERGKNIEVTKVRSQIRNWEGTYIKDYEAEFYSKDIDSRADKLRREALIGDFVRVAMNRDSYTPSEFLDLTKINILITNFKNPEPSCPKEPATPEISLKGNLYKSFKEDLVEVIIDNSEVAVTSSSDAITRGSVNNADIVIWSSQYIDHCIEEDSTIIYYELLSNKKEDFLEPRNSPGLKGVLSIYDTLSKELRRIIFWKKGREAMGMNDWEKADYFISKLPDIILKIDEKAEKYYLLGSIKFSIEMDSDKFDKCQHNFHTCISNSDDNRFIVEWLQLLKLLAKEGLDKQVKEKSKTEFQNQAEKLLKNLDKDFPSNRDEFLFCLELAKELKIKKYDVKDNLKKDSFNSPSVIKAQIEYLDAIGEIGDAKGKANSLCTDYPFYPFGYAYLSKQYESEGDFKNALKSALKVKDLANPNAEQYFRLSDLYLKNEMLDSCRYYYLMGIYLDPKLKCNNIEKKLGLIKDNPPPVPPVPPVPEPSVPVRFITYTVRNAQSYEDVLGWFEENFGRDMKRKVENLNEYNDNDMISEGTILTISNEKGGITYAVKDNDNLTTIAKFCNDRIDNPPDITPESLKSLNGIPGRSSNPVICPGQILIIAKGTETRIECFPESKNSDEVSRKKNIERDALIQLNGNSNCSKKCWVLPPKKRK